MKTPPARTGEIVFVAFLAWLVLGAGCLVVSLLFDSEARRVAHTAADASGVLLWAAAVGGSLLLVGIPAVVLRRAMVRMHHVYPDDSGLYPLVPAGRYENPTPVEVQMLHAGITAHQALGQRPTAAVTRALVQGVRQPALPAPAPMPALPERVIDGEIVDAGQVQPWTGNEIDLAERPHFGFFGATGSGKSTAVFALARRLGRMFPDARFLVLEAGGATWGMLCAAWSDEGVAGGVREVEAEMERRENVLRLADVQAADELHPDERPERLFCVVEEAESAIDNLRKLARREDADRTAIALRNVARRGRKCHVHLITASQYPRSDSFDTAVRNNLQLYVMRGLPGLAELLRISREVNISQLPPGVAYSVFDRRLVQFPKVERPLLRLSGLYRETGITGGQGVIAAGDTGWGNPAAPLPAAELPATPGELVSDAVVRRVYSAYCGAGEKTIKGTQRALFPEVEVGGWRWYWLREVVRHAEGHGPHPDHRMHLDFER